MSEKTDQFAEAFALKLKTAGVPIAEEDGRVRFAELEAQLKKRLPVSFGSFLSRYSFPSFEVGGISFFSWQRETDQYTAEASSKRGGLSELLLPAGFFQIGRPDTGDFDAVCFDLNRTRQNREYPIVRISHEDILCHWRVNVLGELWPSFRKLAEVALSDPVSHICYEKPLI